jgi:hypothetical protein
MVLDRLFRSCALGLKERSSLFGEMLRESLVPLVLKGHFKGNLSSRYTVGVLDERHQFLVSH